MDMFTSYGLNKKQKYYDLDKFYDLDLGMSL